MSKSKFKKILIPFNKIRRDFFDFQRLNYMPRWTIFCIDIAIVAIAGIINLMLMQSLNIEFYKVLPQSVSFLLYITVVATFFILFRTYSGLIRHSSFLDAIKLLLAVGLAHIFVIFADFAQWFFTHKKIYVTTVIIFSFVLSYLLLLLFRITVKTVFGNLYSSKNDQKIMKAVVFGTDFNAIAIANALRKESPIRFEIVAFIDQNVKSNNKRIFDIPIIPIEDSMAQMLYELEIEAAIVVDGSLTKDEKFSIVDECLNNDIKVFAGPLISDWDSGSSVGTQIRVLKIEDLLQRDQIDLDSSNVSNSIFNKIALVTGGAGSIGSEIIFQLATHNPRRIIIVDQAETPMHDLELQIKAKYANIDFVSIIADITDANEMEKVFSLHKPNYVYHAAAYKHVPMMEKNISQAVLANVMGVKIVAELAVKYNVKKFVFISTDKAVNPTNIMGATKRISEIFTQALFFHSRNQNPNVTKFITTRFGNVLGSNGSVVKLFSKQIEEGGPLTLTHPDVTRYFMTIPEACQLVLEAGAMGSGGEIFLFDMGKPIKILDLAKKMIQLSGLKPYTDIGIKFVGLRPGEKLYEELLTEASITQPTHHEKILIAKETVYDFTDIEKKVLELIDSIRANQIELTLEQIKVLVPEYYNPDYSNNAI